MTWSFGRLQATDVRSLLSRLREAETPVDWNAIIGEVIEDVASREAALTLRHMADADRRAWEADRIALRRLIERGFRAPPRRPRGTIRGRADAHLITTWGRARTFPEAVAFLISLDHRRLDRDREIIYKIARNRVLLAIKAGLRLTAAPRGGARARKPPSL
jgi:hypothetical protein